MNEKEDDEFDYRCSKACNQPSRCWFVGMWQSRVGKSKKYLQPEEGGLRKKKVRSCFSNTAGGASMERDMCKKFAETKALKNVSKCNKIIFSDDDLFMDNSWRMNVDETPINFLDLFTKSSLNEEREKKLSKRDEKQFSPLHAQEFHELTEVHKIKILRAVKNMIKKLANEDSSYETRDPKDAQIPSGSNNFETGRFSSRKFSFNWIVIKIVEMVLCHITQIVFLSEGTYFQKKNEFLPVVFTYYIMLFVIMVSLVAILTLSLRIVQNPCYIMAIVSSSVLTITTALGILIMLTTMQYFDSFLQVSVLVFFGILICLFFAELCLLYVEMKNVWKKILFREEFFT